MLLTWHGRHKGCETLRAIWKGGEPSLQQEERPHRVVVSSLNLDRRYEDGSVAHGSLAP